MTLPGVAQFRASLQGSITDPTGAIIPGATVTLTDKATNHTNFHNHESGSGVYTFNALPPDQFTLTVTATGFKKKTLDNVKILPEQANAVNVTLELGQTTQTVTVSGSQAAALDTETATLSGNIDSNQIQHLPSFNRDVFQLAQLAPGAFGDASQASGGAATTCLEIKGLVDQVTAHPEFSRRKTGRRFKPVADNMRPTASPWTASAP